MANLMALIKKRIKIFGLSKRKDELYKNLAQFPQE